MSGNAAKAKPGANRPVDRPVDRPIDRPGDRRTERTRSALRDALLQLMAEHGWDGFGVQELCERANIGRSTFYMHYPNKEALLTGGFDDLRSFLRQRHAAAAGTSPDLVLGLLQHVHENRRLFRSLIGRRSGYVVEKHFREMLMRVIAEDLGEPARGPAAAALAHWLSGGLFGLLTWWVDTRSPPDAHQLHALYRRLRPPPGTIVV